MAGGGNHDGSLFHVGSNVTLTHVLVFLSVLVVSIVVIERLLHHLEAFAKQRAKHREMLSHAYRELMILGFIGLQVKIYKEISRVSAYDESLIAFQVADLTTFLLAVVLMLQAAAIFVVLRRDIAVLEHADLVSTHDVVETMRMRHEAGVLYPPLSVGDRLRATFSRGACPARGIGNCRAARALSSAALPNVVRLRVLRHLLLRRFMLPEFFPFAMYVRQAMDNSITHMIDVQVKTWALLLAVAWGLEGTSQLFRQLQRSADETSIAIAFAVLAWLLVAVHVAARWYFSWIISRLLEAGGLEDLEHPTECLQRIAEDEAKVLSDETAGAALEQMQLVCERRENPALVSEETHPAVLKPLPHARFTHATYRFLVMALLMVNALFVALMCQCVLHQLRAVSRKYSLLLAISLPLPTIVNTFFLQPRIVRNFVMASSIYQLDRTSLCEVVTEFTDVVEQRSEFAAHVLTRLADHGLSLEDLKTTLEQQDARQSGRISVEELRRVLEAMGARWSYFRFSTLVKTLFKLKGGAIEYAQLMRLLVVAQQGEAMGESIATATADGSKALRPKTLLQRHQSALLYTNTQSVRNLMAESAVDSEEVETAMDQGAAESPKATETPYVAV
ncbi:hypothetical protein ATCC90586_004783 [Pythium insidiosum]|nr:hypothetical protein ATCC90586_004783 [Pythium insidiosum]